jgi:predicted nucleotidyltransferase
MLLPPEFKKLLSALSTKNVDYLLVGGYAVVFHGYVRTTGDIDIWVALAEENAKRVEAAIRSLDFNPPGMKPEWFTKKGAVLRIGSEPLRFDIINDIDGVQFSECYSRRIECEIDGVPVKVISLQDLKKNKKASGRNKDLADLDYLP